jgi:hypothetical protein
MEKYAARSAKQEIDRVLWEVWDPIGVNQFPYAQHEGLRERSVWLLTSGASGEFIVRKPAQTTPVLAHKVGVFREFLCNATNCWLCPQIR